VNDDELLSSADAARIAGVGQTAIKRWADAGALPCIRTPGGHRRFRREDVERLAGRAVTPGSTGRWDEWIDRLVARPDGHLVIARLFQERANAGSWHGVTSRLASLVTEIGHRWETGRMTVIEEHLASATLQRALAAVVEGIPIGTDAPVCLLATAEGNEHTVGLSLVELCLREAGWRAEWAGNRTPTTEVIARIARGGLDGVALSAAVNAPDAAALAAIASDVGDACRAADVHLFMGGAGQWPDAPVYGTRLQDLSRFYVAVAALRGGPSAN
jgi:excisionase family DNA binding protein